MFVRSPSAPGLLAFVGLPPIRPGFGATRATGDCGRHPPSATVRGEAVTWSAVATKSRSDFCPGDADQCLKAAEGGMPSIVRYF